jgi:hypothetical protein
MIDIKRKVRTIRGVTPDNVPYQDLMDADEPVILKGLVRQWGLVEAGLQSPATAMDYLQSYDAGRPIISYVGGPEIKGRFFYNADMSGLNFTSNQMKFVDFTELVRTQLGNDNAPAYYIGSTTIDVFFPGLKENNDLVFNHMMFEQNRPLASIWIGNRTIASAHYDLSNNIACCSVGRRRFTLFPPEQIENLYPGPLEPTPGGQVVSTVDFDNPNFEKHPRFRRALESAQVADMEPGDALFYPSMWWHQVESLDHFNVMINYWWNTSPSYIDTPMNTLLHAMLSLRDRPEHEKRAWKSLFDYYIFGPAGRAAEHLPGHIQGNLAPMDEIRSRRLRAYLLSRLNR